MAPIKIALVQFDAVPEQPAHNLKQMDRLVEKAAVAGARWIVFHENTVCDYTADPGKFSEPVPDGASTAHFIRLAAQHAVVISFGLIERDGERLHITQVFVGPTGFIHKYRKSWLWYLPAGQEGAWRGGHRNEWKYFDPGSGPELFEIDGVRASCFICADGNAERCLSRVRALQPHVVFHPNNRPSLVTEETYAHRARAVAAPLLVTNRVGRSWVQDCDGGSSIFGSNGALLAKANRQGDEEVLLHELVLWRQDKIKE